MKRIILSILIALTASGMLAQSRISCMPKFAKGQSYTYLSSSTTERKDKIELPSHVQFIPSKRLNSNFSNFNSVFDQSDFTTKFTLTVLSVSPYGITVSIDVDSLSHNLPQKYFGDSNSLFDSVPLKHAVITFSPAMDQYVVHGSEEIIDSIQNSLWQNLKNKDKYISDIMMKQISKHSFYGIPSASIGKIYYSYFFPALDAFMDYCRQAYEPGLHTVGKPLDGTNVFATYKTENISFSADGELSYVSDHDQYFSEETDLYKYDSLEYDVDTAVVDMGYCRQAYEPGLHTAGKPLDGTNAFATYKTEDISFSADRELSYVSDHDQYFSEETDLYKYDSLEYDAVVDTAVVEDAAEMVADTVAIDTAYDYSDSDSCIVDSVAYDFETEIDSTVTEDNFIGHTHITKRSDKQGWPVEISVVRTADTRETLWTKKQRLILIDKPKKK